MTCTRDKDKESLQENFGDVCMRVKIKGTQESKIIWEQQKLY